MSSSSTSRRQGVRQSFFCTSTILQSSYLVTFKNFNSVILGVATVLFAIVERFSMMRDPSRIYY